jgi:hypothetical protein
VSSNPVRLPILRPSAGYAFARLLAHRITGPAALAASPPSSRVAASPFARADPGGSGAHGIGGGSPWIGSGTPFPMNRDAVP